jgi:hypothetical protein
MTLSEEAFVAFCAAVLVGTAAFAWVWTHGPTRRWRIVDQATGEVRARTFTRLGGRSKAYRLSGHGFSDRFVLEHR